MSVDRRLEDMVCAACGAVFRPPRATAKFCSRPCMWSQNKGRPRTPFESRFWDGVAKGHENECWPWVRTKNTTGYGLIARGGRYCKFVATHRASYEIHYGAIPRGAHVLHRCDNPACVNPAHLFLGTHRDNMADMVRKGRHQHTVKYGKNNGASKLSAASVAAIRAASGTTRSIASQFGISRGHVSHIRSGKGRRHG